jgi:transposase
VWSRQRQLNQLRSTLREFYPGALQAFGRDLASPEACTILAIASTPERGRRLTPAQISRSLRVSGRRRRLTQRATEIREALRASQLELPSVLAKAYGEAVRSLVALIDGLRQQIDRLEQELAARFEGHPDAEILRSLPGLGLVLGARVLAEFGDDPTRYADARTRRCYAGSAPITKPRGCAKSSLPGSPATGAWLTRATSGRSPR